ncbi:hypothetical protein L3Y34_011365 [Caenorhabditis briggsae]|uniref:Uncharacterized protein n=1 Tax=Caenorhabditis briggsae TaxID=6238 RepID=A0AAE9CTW4_CAEBR|nr:hypothetical protein L3Y34_011365 [Caenorhabditis briggsae]
MIKILRRSVILETHPLLGQIVFDDVEFAYSTRPSSNVLDGIGNRCSRWQQWKWKIFLLQQYYQPSSGRILLDGTAIEQMANVHEFVTRIEEG